MRPRKEQEPENKTMTRFRMVLGDRHLGWIHRPSEAEALADAARIFKNGLVVVEVSE